MVAPIQNNISTVPVQTPVDANMTDVNGNAVKAEAPAPAQGQSAGQPAPTTQTTQTTASPSGTAPAGEAGSPQAASGQTSAPNTAGSQAAASTGEFNFDFSQINATPEPDLGGLGSEMPDTSVDTGLSRRDLLNQAFENSIKDAKAGNTQALDQVVTQQELSQISLTEEVENQGQEEKNGQEGDGEARRFDLYGRVSQNVTTSKKMAARLKTEAESAEKLQDKKLAQLFTNQYLRLKTSGQKLEQKVQENEAQTAFGETRDKAKEFGKLTQTPTKLSPEQQKKLALLEKKGDSFKAGDAAAGRNRPEAGVPKPKVAKIEVKEAKAENGDEGVSAAEEAKNETGVDTSGRRVAKPTKTELEDANKKVAILVDPKTREKRMEASKKKGENLRLVKAALRDAGQNTPEDAGQKALAQGAKGVYRRESRQAYDDILGGNSSMTGLVYFGTEGKSLAALAEKPDTGVRGQNTAASLAVSSEPKEINPQDAPKQLAALNRNSKPIEEMPILSLFNWKPRGERDPSVRDLVADGASRGQVAV